MKKLMLLLFIVSGLLLTGCEPEPVISTYQVFNNSSHYSSSVPYLDGSMYEVVVFCYAGNDVVREDNFTKIAVGEKTQMKEVTESITKIKVSFKFLPAASSVYSTATRQYVVAYTLIEPGKNVISEINDNSMTKGTMNIKQQIRTIK